MTPKEVQIEFESVTFMHERPVDYIDIYSEPPRKYDRNYRGD